MFNKNLGFGLRKTEMGRSVSVWGNIKSAAFCLVMIAVAAQGLIAQNDISRSGVTSEEVKTVKSAEIADGQTDNLTPSFTEGFEGGVVPAGWTTQNRSTTIGTNTNCWNPFTGATPWAAQAGTGHIGANFNCTTGANTISGWLFSPEILFRNGDQIRFWTRKASPDTFPDRLELRLSTNGTSTNVGTTSTSVGDFTVTLVSVNPTLVTGVYPTTYTQFTATISGVPTPTNGRVAFRYFVTNGGPSGANSDIISIDTFQYVAAPTAANASISGQVLSPSGRGVYRATVQMIDQNGNVRTANTNNFGFYRFEDVQVGANYIFNVFAKQYFFDSQIVNVVDNVQDLNFTAQEQ